MPNQQLTEFSEKIDEVHDDVKSLSDSVEAVLSSTPSSELVAVNKLLADIQTAINSLVNKVSAVSKP